MLHIAYEFHSINGHVSRELGFCVISELGGHASSTARQHPISPLLCNPIRLTTTQLGGGSALCRPSPPHTAFFGPAASYHPIKPGLGV
jgi:hypothetical protein